MTKPAKKPPAKKKRPTKLPKRLTPPKSRPPLLLGPSANPGRPPRTSPLPGMEEPQIEEIRDLALKYFHLRDQKASLSKREEAAKQELLDAMHAHKLKRYFDVESELLVEIENASEKIRVTVGKEQE